MVNPMPNYRIKDTQICARGQQYLARVNDIAFLGSNFARVTGDLLSEMNLTSLMLERLSDGRYPRKVVIKSRRISGIKARLNRQYNKAETALCTYLSLVSNHEGFRAEEIVERDHATYSRVPVYNFVAQASERFAEEVAIPTLEVANGGGTEPVLVTTPERPVVVSPELLEEETLEELVEVA